MAFRRNRASRTERIVTALIWFVTFVFLGVALGFFFSSSVLLYVMIAAGVLVAFLVDRSVVRSYIEGDDS